MVKFAGIVSGCAARFRKMKQQCSAPHSELHGGKVERIVIQTHKYK